MLVRFFNLLGNTTSQQMPVVKHIISEINNCSHLPRTQGFSFLKQESPEQSGKKGHSTYSTRRKWENV